MGKQSRSKRRKAKSSLTDSPLALIEAKETFIYNLSQIFSSYFSLFQTSLQNRIAAKPPPPFKTSSISLKTQNCELFYKQDESREFHHIFYLHLQKFLSQLLLSIREIEDIDHKLIVPCINDAFILLENARIDLEKITKFLFASAGIDCKSMIFLIFHEHIIYDKFIQRIVQEDRLKDETIFGFVENNMIFDDFITKTQKKRKRKQKKVEHNTDEEVQMSEEGPVNENTQKILQEDKLKDEEGFCFVEKNLNFDDFIEKAQKKRKRKQKKIENTTELDEEVQMFEERLMNEKELLVKEKPNVSNEWILQLRKLLKNR